MEQEQIIKTMKKITGILDVLICLLLFISALYKGAFYKEDTLFISMVVSMLGLVCLSVKLVLNIRDNRKINKSKLATIVDICVILMPITYFLPVLFGKAASMESAIFESIRYINFAIVYFIVRTTQNKKIYLTSIALIGIVLAMLGIDELTYRAIEKILSPISINYLSENSGKISSTIQYANITALIMLISNIIIQNKVVKNIIVLNKKIGIKFKSLVVLELFSLVLLQSAIILTTSRMNIILMIITSIIYSIHCIKNGNKKSSLTVLLMLIASFALVTSIDTYLLLQNNFMVCFTYLITFLLIIIGMIISTKFKVESIKTSKKELNKKTKILRICVLVLLIIMIASILGTPNKLRVNDTTGEGTTVTRNIYCDLEKTLNIDVEYNFYRNNNFVMHIYQVDENFNKKILLSLTKDSLKDNGYITDVILSETAESLLLEFITIDSDISIESLKINGEDVTLSYMFIPDTIVFRLKDTLINDSNNSLRFTYYKDAFKLFNTSKLFGIGGEGFKARYQEVQTENYISSEVHSTPLQILVETGITGFIIFLTLCSIVCIILYNLCKNKNEHFLVYSLILVSFLITAAFDLVFSFGIMIYFFAIVVGLIIGEYRKDNILPNDKFEVDNKSILGMLKIATLSISLMALFIVTIYSVNIYRASMIIVGDDEQTLESSYKRVGLLETKLRLDKYNIAYLNSLLSSYDNHIDLLNEIYLIAQTEEENQMLKTEINNYIIKQKEVADSIIECEYYNKYAIEKVARCYFKHYTSYAHIFNENFKNDEIAYVFYVGYGIKLTDRLTKIGKVNNLAHKFAIDIYEEYLPVIEKQNSIINSEMLSQAIQDMRQKLEVLQGVKQ